MADVLIVGFGGQGVQLMGKLLAEAAIFDGKNTTYVPSYSAEMRGGSSNCTVIISSGDMLESPVVSHPEVLIALDRKSLVEFERELADDGLLIANSSLIETVNRQDIQVIMVPASQLAEDLGSPRAVNMVALGVYVAITLAVTQESVERAIKENFKEKPALIDPNLRAFCAGVAIGGEYPIKRAS